MNSNSHSEADLIALFAEDANRAVPASEFVHLYNDAFHASPHSRTLHINRLAPIIAAALVVAVAIAVSQIHSGKSTGGNTQRSASGAPDPTTVTSISWQLERIDGSAVAGDQLLLFNGDGTFQFGLTSCNEWIGVSEFTSATAAFSDTRIWNHRCPNFAYTSTPDGQLIDRQNATAESVLTGTAAWHLDGHELTFTKPSGESITFRARPTDPPSPS
jgi:heat shock protein HslJ